MTNPSDLCFVAVIPPEPVLTEVRAFKEIAEVKFDSRRALRSPAHITLVPPFRAGRTKQGHFAEQLKHGVARLAPFEVHLSGFAAFKPRVIFVEVMPDAGLDHLYETVMTLATSALGLTPSRRPFHPHMTVAFKDLRRQQFAKAWSYFSSIEYARSFQVDCIWLLRHEPKGWIPSLQIPVGVAL